jgi:hypothetical protein
VLTVLTAAAGSPTGPGCGRPLASLRPTVALAGDYLGRVDQLQPAVGGRRPVRLEAILNPVRRLATVRATLQILTPLSITWALVATIADA